MRLLLRLMRPLWLRLFKLYAIRGNVECHHDLHLGIGSKIFAPHRLTIGRDVYIGKLCTIECDGRIGDEVMIANSVGIVGRHDHDYTVVGKSIRRAPWIGNADYVNGERNNEITIGSDVWIGYGAVVLSGITVGRGAVVAAGAVVTRDVAPYAIVAGNPARQVASRFSAENISRHEALLEAAAAPSARKVAAGSAGTIHLLLVSAIALAFEIGSGHESAGAPIDTQPQGITVASAGAPPRGTLGIELDGSGAISRHVIEDFNDGAIVYGSGFRVHSDAFPNAVITHVLNYSKRDGVIELEPVWSGTPRHPERAGGGHSTL